MERSYTAFISYRHCPTDIAVAEKLHKLLEHYYVPKDLRKGNEKGLGVVFRDRDELPLSNNLTGDIYTALDRSQFLIVICTPDTPKSLWVDKEIEHFINKHGRDRILVVLASGTPETSIPKRITTVYADDSETILEQFEPLCAYLVAPTQRQTFHNLEKEMPRLAAAILGCPYDSLIQRQKRYALKKGLTIASCISGAILCVALGFILMLTNKNAQIQAQLHQSQLNESKALSLISTQLLAEGDRMGALEKALAALPSSENDRPYSAVAEYALTKALHIYQDEGIYFDRKIEAGDQIRAFTLSDDGSHAVVIDANGYLRCFDVKNGQELWNYGIEYYYYYGYEYPNNRLFILEDDYIVFTYLFEIQVHDILTGDILYVDAYNPQNGIDLNEKHYSDEVLQSAHTTYIDNWNLAEYSPATGTLSPVTQQAANVYRFLNFQDSPENRFTCLIPLSDPDCILFLQPNQRTDVTQIALTIPSITDAANAIYSFPSGDRFLIFSRWNEPEEHFYRYTCSIRDTATLQETKNFSFTSEDLLGFFWTFSPDETKLFQDGVVLDLEKGSLTDINADVLVTSLSFLYEGMNTTMPSRIPAEAPVFTAHFDPTSDVLYWLENGQNIQERECPYDLVESMGWMHPWNATEVSGNGLILIRNYTGNITHTDTDENSNRLRPTEYIIYSIEDDKWQQFLNPCTEDGIPALTFGLSHPWIAFADFDETLRIYDQETESITYQWDLSVSASSVSHLQFLCDDTLLLIRQKNNLLHIMDTATGTILGSYALTDFSDTREFNCAVVSNETNQESTAGILYISDITAQGTGLRIDMESWTVLAEIPHMACYLADIDAVVCTSDFSNNLRILPIYSLSELIKHGNEIVVK